VLADYGGRDAALVANLGLEASILQKLAQLEKDERLSSFFKALALFLDELRRNPTPTFIRDAHKITAASEKRERKRSLALLED
jgi:hypothetical protein